MLLRFLPVDMDTFSSFISVEGRYVLYDWTTVIYPLSVGGLSAADTDTTRVHFPEGPASFLGSAHPAGES